MAEESTFGRRPDYARHEHPVRYTVALEPHHKTWLFALDVPGALPPDTRLRGDLQLRALRPIGERYHYEMLSWVDFRYGERTSRGALDRALAYPAQRNPRVVALGRQWATETTDQRDILLKALRLYNREFSYTLEPPLLDPVNPYDDFVFHSKQGFCEHFSGSFALLMRPTIVGLEIVCPWPMGSATSSYAREAMPSSTNLCRGISPIASSTRSSAMPSRRSMSTMRRRVRSDVMPMPLPVPLISRSIARRRGSGPRA